MSGPRPVEWPGDLREVVEVELEVSGGRELVEVGEWPGEREQWWLCDTEVPESVDRQAPHQTVHSVSLEPGSQCGGAAGAGDWKTRTAPAVAPSGRRGNSPSRGEFCSSD